MSALPSRLPSSRRVLMQRLEDWLFRTVQLERGPDCGGVIGSTSSVRGPEYLYPEAAGYFLTWLAFLGSMRGVTPDLSARAFRAATWLSHQAGDGLTTRRYLNGEAQDWRNRGLFSFDLAMACRGVAAVRGWIPQELADECLDRLLRLFSRLCPGDGSLMPVLPRTNAKTRDLPCRWSTRPGPYQLKSAAAILGIPREIAGIRLHEEMARVYFRWRDHYREHPADDELHPLLYHIEGLVLGFACGIDDGGLTVAGALYPTILRRVRSCARSDVLAQTLRAGCLVPLPTGGHGAMTRPREALLGLLEENGAPVSRRVPHGGARHWNTWSAIFSHQALALLDRVEHGEIPRRAEMELLA